MHNKLLAITFILLTVSAGLWAAADDPFVGTWNLNPAKSRVGSGPQPKGSTIQFERHGTGIRVTRDGVDAKGNAEHWEYTANFDDKDYPVKGDPVRDAVAVKRIDAYNLEVTNKKDGKVNDIQHSVVSKDGKTLTLKWKRANRQGELIDNVRVYEKQ